jgi:integrase
MRYDSFFTDFSHAMAKFNIKTVQGREALPPRPAPFFLAVDRGWAIGYRKNKIGGVWVLRQTEMGKHQHRPIEIPPSTPPGEEYAVAHRFFRRHQSNINGGLVEGVTFRSAFDEYVDAFGKDDSSKRVNARTLRSALDFGAAWFWQIALEEINKKVVARLVDDLRKGKTCGQRADSTVERMLNTVSAAASKQRLSPEIRESISGHLFEHKAVRIPRNVYLTVEERLALVDAADGPIKHLLWLLTRLPVRPNALTRRRVKDFDLKDGSLKIEGDKGQKHNRTIYLPSDVVSYLSGLCDGKSQVDYILDGCRDPSMLARKFRLIADQLGHHDAVIYSFRHSRLTDLAQSFNALQLARLAGTSIGELERTYFQQVKTMHRTMLESI